jgi:integrase
MPKIAFSDTKLRSLPIPQTGQVDYWCNKLAGFGVRVSQGGSKTFVLNIHNSRRAIGRYPLISLSKARTEAKRLLAERTLGKVRPQSITYQQAVQVFLEEKSTRRRARTVADHKRHLTLLPFKCQLTDISHDDLSRKLEKLPPSEFNHRLSCAKTFFIWAQKKRYIIDNPVIGLSPHSRPSRARVLSDDELKKVWDTCSDKANELPQYFRIIVKLLILTGQRRGEIAALKSEYFSNDTCTLPASLTKNGREHSFPVGRTAFATIPVSVPNGLLFAAKGKSSTPFNGWSKSKAALDEISGVENWTLHDLRRTFATNLAKLGTSIHVIEKLLNHVSGTISGVAAVYNRSQYMPEMREAVDKWEAKLTTLLNNSA